MSLTPNSPAAPPRIEPSPVRLRVEFAGILIADADNALRVVEPSGDAACYAPPASVKQHFLAPMRHSPVCPWRGPARSFTLSVRGRHAEAAAWTYDNPGPGFEKLAGLIAFHPNRVDSYSAIELDRQPPALATHTHNKPPRK